MLNTIRRGLNQWLTLVVESPCPLCQRSTPNVFCLNCQRQLQQCQRTPWNWEHKGDLSVLAWGGYCGSLKRAIAALKYHNHPELAEPLAYKMAESWGSLSETTMAAVVVPIPMHKDKQQQRGFNQAELLAKHFCHRTQLPLAANALTRIRETQAQFSLSATERSQNLKDVFRVSDRFLQHSSTRSVLLLDDIYTTGATAHSAAHTLRRQGIRVLGIIVLARTEMETSSENEKK